MKPPYAASAVLNGKIENRVGYVRAAPPGCWTIVEADGNPIRTHDGFAVFTDSKQAKWAAELMNGAFYAGEDAAKKAIRDLLGVPEPIEDDGD